MISSFDIPNLKSLLHDFYILTKIRIVIFDDQFHEITSYPSRLSTYCALIRQDTTAAQKCLQCDRDACLSSKKANMLLTYECHAGLTETVTPITQDKIVIGYIMFGQILQHQDKDSAWKVIRNQCNNYAVDWVKLETAFYKKKYIPKETLLAAAKIMEVCAKYLWLSRMATLSEDTFPSQLDQYITTHLTHSLSAQDLCDHFQISKVKLYKISEHSYGMGIAEYIRQRRLATAKRLLEESNYGIGEISVMVGIEDYNYFTKLFKRETGMTPSRYRRISSK